MITVIKGLVNGIAQDDLTRPLTAGSAAVALGTLLKLVNDKWVIATSADQGSAGTAGPRLFVAYTASTDLQGAFAGNQQGQTASADAEPLITALPLDSRITFETDMLEDTGLASGTPLTVGDDGKFVAKTTDATTCYGFVEAEARSAWHDKTAVEGWRTGGRSDVVAIRSAYIPGLAVD